MRTSHLTLLALAAITAAPMLALAQQDIDREPIRYSQATPQNGVAELQRKLSDGTARLEYRSGEGYLRSVLKARTFPSRRRCSSSPRRACNGDRISPKTPAAIYFNDDVMVGYCLRGYVMELSASDDVLGTVFYTLDQKREDLRSSSARLTRVCSATVPPRIRDFPGHLVCSLFTDRQGTPILSSGSYRTDHTSPLDERWGGWYVTGTSGNQNHLGNRIGPGPNRRGPVPNPTVSTFWT